MTQRLQTALEVFSGQHFVEQCARQRFACVDVGRHVAQHAPLPAEIFHELAGQLDRVPLHPADARHITFVHLREHVMQAVAAFVEEGDDIVMGEQRWFATHAFGEVAYQVSHRRLQRTRVGAQPAGAHIVHPRAATFACACTGIEVELAHQLSCTFHAIELHGRVPHGRAVATNAHLKQGFHNFEQTRQHLGRSEVRFDFLFAERVARFFELLADVRPVPRLWVLEVQVLSRKGAHFCHVFLSVRAGALG